MKGARRIFILGRGLAEYVSQEFTLKLQLLDYNAVFFSDPNIMCKKCGDLRPDELVIIFSLNGRTPELIGLSNYNVWWRNKLNRKRKTGRKSFSNFEKIFVPFWVIVRISKGAQGKGGQQCGLYINNESGY